MPTRRNWIANLILLGTASCKKADPITIDQVFTRLSDFELADGLACSIEDKYGYKQLMRWPPDIPLPHRVVHFIWSNAGFAAVNGYVEFMMLDCNHGALALSFREVVGLSTLRN